MEKPGQTGAGVRGVVISNERLTKSLGTGFRRCNSSENSYGFGHVLFPGAGVLGTVGLKRCVAAMSRQILKWRDAHDAACT